MEQYHHANDGNNIVPLVNARNVHSSGRTILHEACANGHLHIVQTLICDFGADIQRRTYLGGDTPLHLAVLCDHYHIVFCLLNYGADPIARNRYEDTPLHYAQRRSIALLLSQSGARVDAINLNGETPMKAILRREKEER
eukprot:3175276-Ditylum_brightwellii.AAC.1